jgi:tRNA pseudouridine13 synthase
MLYLSTASGSGGVFKAGPQDFIVKEITTKGRIPIPDQSYDAQQLGEQESPEGKFTTFVLQKRSWDTVQLLLRMAKMMGHGKKSIGYCGVKDKQSISVQLASIFGVEPAQVMGLRIRDMKVNGAWKSAGAVELGSNVGNSFTAVIRGCSKPENAARVIDELDGRMPNYFDRQRFGLRMNNHEVGMLIMHGDFRGAVMKFLTDTSNERNEACIAARKRLAQEQDFRAALGYFPAGMRNERSVIEYMSRYDNPANALRKLPRGVLLMFVHSVQSMVFNAALESRIKAADFESPLRCTENFYGFPDLNALSPAGRFPLGALAGYTTDEKAMSAYDKQALSQAGLAREDFKIASMPEVSAKGSTRPLIVPAKDLKCHMDGSDLKVDFSLPTGSYATILLLEITKAV